MKNILNQNTKENFSKKIDWKIIQSEMKNKFGLDIYDSWLRKIDFIDEFTNYVLLSVSTRFIRDWIASRYLDQILQIIKSYKKDVRRIEFIISESKKEDDKNFIEKSDTAHVIDHSYSHIVKFIRSKKKVVTINDFSLVVISSDRLISLATI